MSSPISPVTTMQVAAGKPVPPIKRVRMMEDGDFEALIEAWLERKRKDYTSVVRFGAAGDKGVDVGAFCDAAGLKGVWDGFQCKRYDHPLYPTDVYHDIGKLIWNISNGIYAVPRAYCFMASHDLGTTLNQLLKNTGELRDKLIENWDKHVAATLTDGAVIALEGDLLTAVTSFDFRIFGHEKMTTVLSDLAGSAYYVETFGGGIPARPQEVPIPDAVQQHEMTYTDKLRRAYETHAGQPIADLDSLATHKPLARHFERQRRAFYHAESLREFSKNTVPAGTFEALQQNVLDGVQPVLDAEHATPYARVNAVVGQATTLPLADNPLSTVATTTDRHGVCHQLSNDDRLHWDDPDA